MPIAIRVALVLSLTFLTAAFVWGLATAPIIFAFGTSPTAGELMQRQDRQGTGVGGLVVMANRGGIELFSERVETKVVPASAQDLVLLDTETPVREFDTKIGFSFRTWDDDYGMWPAYGQHRRYWKLRLSFFMLVPLIALLGGGIAFAVRVLRSHDLLAQANAKA